MNSSWNYHFRLIDFEGSESFIRKDSFHIRLSLFGTVPFLCDCNKLKFSFLLCVGKNLIMKVYIFMFNVLHSKLFDKVLALFIWIWKGKCKFYPLIGILFEFILKTQFGLISTVILDIFNILHIFYMVVSIVHIFLYHVWQLVYIHVFDWSLITFRGYGLFGFEIEQYTFQIHKPWNEKMFFR